MPGKANDPLGAFRGKALLGDGVVLDGDAVRFSPQVGWLTVAVSLGPGVHELTLVAAGATGLRVELLTRAGWIGLPITPGARPMAVRFALDADVELMRIMPVEAGPVRFCAFDLRTTGAWDGLLPDWRLGDVVLPHRQNGGIEAADLAAPPGWQPGLRIDGLERVAIESNAFVCGSAGAVRLAFEPALPPGHYVFYGEFLRPDGENALVEPRLWLPSDANGWPAAYFRPREESRYTAALRLARTTSHLVLQPRQERGAVQIARFGWHRRSRLMAGLAQLATVAKVVGQRLSAPFEVAIGNDHRRDGPLAACVRLATEPDRRYRRSLLSEERRIARWLAQPPRRTTSVAVALEGADAALHHDIERQGGTIADGAAADVAVPAGARLAPHALGALERAAAEASPICDRDRRTLGLRSAPSFLANPGNGGVPLVLVHEPRRTALPAPPPAHQGALSDPPAVSIITPTRDAPAHLARFLASSATTRYARRELILVDNGTTHPEALALLAMAEAQDNVTVLCDARPFNFSALVNEGAAHASGDILVLANNDIAFTEPDWLDATVHALTRCGVGVAGGLLDYPDGRVQHAGIVLAGEARVRHLERFAPGADVGYLGRRRALTLVSAVTGALLGVRRETFLALGGFRADRYPVLYNDVDFCLRARQAGALCALVPGARAVHHESISFGAKRDKDLFGRGGPIWRMERAQEADRFRQDWSEALDSDPCYPSACDPLDARFRARV